MDGWATSSSFWRDSQLLVPEFVEQDLGQLLPFLTSPTWISYAKSGPVPAHPVLKVVSQLLEAHAYQFYFLLNGTKICCFTYTGNNEWKDLICIYPQPSKIGLRTWSVYLPIHSAGLTSWEGKVSEGKLPSSIMLCNGNSPDNSGGKDRTWILMKNLSPFWLHHHWQNSLKALRASEGDVWGREQGPAHYWDKLAGPPSS